MCYLTEELPAWCPYCGESISVVVDLSGTGSDSQLLFIEDCEVCCRPISFTAGLDSRGQLSVVAQHENDA